MLKLKCNKVLKNWFFNFYKNLNEKFPLIFNLHFHIIKNGSSENGKRRKKYHILIELNFFISTVKISSRSLFCLTFPFRLPHIFLSSTGMKKQTHISFYVVFSSQQKDENFSPFVSLFTHELSLMFLIRVLENFKWAPLAFHRWMDGKTTWKRSP